MLFTTERQQNAPPERARELPAESLLLQGFRLAWRNWPLVVWGYAINLGLGLLAGVAFGKGLAPFLDHSQAAQRIAGTIDLSVLAELSLHLRDAHFAPMVFGVAAWLHTLELLLFFLLFTGTSAVYLSGEQPRISTLARGCRLYLWGMVRGSLLACLIAAIAFGVVLFVRSTLLEGLQASNTGHTLFLYAAITGVLALVCGLLLRLWLDLVQVHIVRAAMSGELRARNSLLPACRLLFRHFLRLFGTYVLPAIAGGAVLALCLVLWKILPADAVVVAALLGQVGLFGMLAVRFWQRAITASFLLAVDPPFLAFEQLVTAVEEERVIPLQLPAPAITGFAEPTLSELVQRLQSDPWTRPVDPAYVPSVVLPVVAPEKTAPATVATQGSAVQNRTGAEVLEKKAEAAPADSLVSRHGTKFPLGGKTDASDSSKAPPAPVPPPEKPPAQ